MTRNVDMQIEKFLYKEIFHLNISKFVISNLRSLILIRVHNTETFNLTYSYRVTSPLLRTFFGKI